MQVGSHLSLGLTDNPDWDPALQSAIQVEEAASHLSHLSQGHPTWDTRHSRWEKWDPIWDLRQVSL